MPALLILGLVAAAGVGTGMYVSAANFQDPTLQAKIGGMDMSNVVALGGLALAFLASGPLAMAGLAVSVGSLVAGYDAKQVKAGLQAHAVQQVNQGAALLAPPRSSGLARAWSWSAPRRARGCAGFRYSGFSASSAAAALIFNRYTGAPGSGCNFFNQSGGSYVFPSTGLSFAKSRRPVRTTSGHGRR